MTVGSDCAKRAAAGKKLFGILVFVVIVEHSVRFVVIAV